MTRKLLVLAAFSVALIAAPSADATTYNNDTPIIIPGQGTATPYGSSITVSGTAGPITDVNVGLDGLAHGRTGEVAIALVAPSGHALALQLCAGNDDLTLAAFLTFDDVANAFLPPDGGLVSGGFKPTRYCLFGPTFPAPGPASYASPGGMGIEGGATLASVFNGLSAIGTWNLYVLDTANVNNSTGAIPGGWSLDVKPDVTPPPPVTPISTLAPAPSLTCGTGTVQEGSQCVVKKKKKKKRKRRKR